MPVFGAIFKARGFGSRRGAMQLPMLAPFIALAAEMALIAGHMNLPGGLP